MSLRTALPATFALLASLAAPAWAHGGHHAPAWHWHASDAWGFVLLGALAALGIWLSRRD